MEGDVVQRLLHVGILHLYLGLPVPDYLGLKVDGVAVAFLLHGHLLLVPAGGNHRQRGFGQGVDVAVRQVLVDLAVVDLEPGVDAGGFVHRHRIGHLHPNPQVVVEAHHRVDQHVGAVDRGLSAVHLQPPFSGHGLGHVQHDIAAILGGGDARLVEYLPGVPQHVGLAAGVHHRHPLQHRLVLGHKGDVHRSLGDAVVGHGEGRVQRRAFHDGLYRFRGALGLDEHLHQLAVQVGLGGHQHVVVFAVLAHLTAASLGQLVDEHHEGVGIGHVLLVAEGDDLEISALGVHLRHDLGRLFVRLDVLGAAEGIGAIGQVVHAVRQQYDAGIPLKASHHIAGLLQGGANVGIDVPAGGVGRGVQVFADLVVQGRVRDVQRAVADAVLRAAEHDHAQLAPAAHLPGGHHVLVHQLRGVEPQASGVGGAAQRMLARGAAAVVDDQYVVMGLHHRVLLRRFGQARPGQCQQCDQYADAPSAHAL